MPPSVATSQLPKDSAHATKEPLAKAGLSAFLGGCCTNNTRPSLEHLYNILFLFMNFYRVILTSEREHNRPLTEFSPSHVRAEIESNEAYANPRKTQCDN